MKKEISIRNKKAKQNYEILDSYTAGISLLGSEVKSIKESAVVLDEAYCQFTKGSLFIKNMYIGEFKGSTVDTYRDRQLLLNKKELKKLEDGVIDKGISIIPLKLFTADNGLIKVWVGLCKGKNKSDKRNSLKESDSKRELDKAKKEYGKY